MAIFWCRRRRVLGLPGRSGRACHRVVLRSVSAPRTERGDSCAAPPARAVIERVGGMDQIQFVPEGFLACCEPFKRHGADLSRPWLVETMVFQTVARPPTRPNVEQAARAIPEAVDGCSTLKLRLLRLPWRRDPDDFVRYSTELEWCR